MKLFSYRDATVVAGLGLFLAAVPFAHGTITVTTSNSYQDVSITPSAGTVTYTMALGSAVYSQAGAIAQYVTAPPASASSSDVPALGALATGAGSSSLSPLMGSSSATGFIPGMVDGFDTSAGRASAGGTFEITGISGQVNVTLSAMISGSLDLSADAYGVLGEGETVFTLSLNDTPYLFSDNIQTIGPDQSIDEPFSTTLSDSVMLTANTPYYLWIESDAEAEVVNSSVSQVPDSVQGPISLACFGLVALLLFVMRRRTAAPALLAIGALVFLTGQTQAMYIGSDPPDPCPTCSKQLNRLPGGTGMTSLPEGNSRQDYSGPVARSAYGPTLGFTAIYNSYNADGSKAQLDTGMGFGWTHSYNSLLFSQRGQMFRLGSDGRVTQYYMNYSSPGTYTSDTGYFETMTMQGDGTFYITNKYQSWSHYGSVPGTPFLVAGPVYRLLQMGDRNQNVTTMTYDASGNLTMVMDPYGRTLQYSYDAHHHLSTVTDPLGRATTFQYDAQNRMPTQITDPLGNTTRYTYNAQYQMTRKVDRDGRMYFYTYKDDRPYMVTDGGGSPYFSMSNSTDWSVNATNLAYTLRRSYVPSTTSVTDGNGNVWQYVYDTNGYVGEVIAPDGATKRYTYDTATLQVSTMTDANGNVTRYQYSADGNRTQMTDALGNITTWTYDLVFSQTTSVTDPLGRVTQWQYDPHGNLIKEIDPLSQSQSWTYDANGNVLTATDKRGNTTTNVYDSLGLLMSTSDPLGNTTTITYDAMGNVIATTDPLGRVTLNQYDALDRRIGSTNALGGITTWTYDPVGNLITTTDPNTNTTTRTYDDRSRLIQIIDPLGGTIRYNYDADNNQLTRTNQRGYVTSNSYDAQNRMTNTIDPLGGVMRHTYDAVGNQITSIDPNTNTTSSTYDALNRVIDKTNALSGVTKYSYSTVGGPPCCSATPGSSLLTEMQDPDGNVTYYHYDELNRRVQVVRKNSDTNDDINPTDAVTTTAYDADNNVTAVTDPNGNTTTTTYDVDNRQIRMMNAAGDTTLWSYDADGNMITITAPNLNTATNGYDALNRLITTYDEVGQVVSNSYDPVGNVLTMTDGLGHTTTYMYDGLNRRVSMTDALGKTATTAYDADSDMISRTDRNGHTTTYTYDGLDRRVMTTDALGDTTTTAYDADSNKIGLTDANGHTTTFLYDALNRLVTETYPDAIPNTRNNVYDAVGNVIERIDQDGHIITYSYNDLYYMTNRAYLPSGANDTFIYDDGGRPLSAARNGWVDTFAYDGADRLTNTAQNGRTFTYTYDIAGRTQTNTEPSGRTLTYGYDARSRMDTLEDGTNPPIAIYVYDAADRVVTRTYRNGTAAYSTYDADNRMMSLTHSNGPALITGFTYTYDNEGNRLDEDKLDNPGNSTTYTYDAINRLTNYEAGTLSGPAIPSPTLNKSWVLDAVGNWNNLISNSVPDVRTYGPANELLTDNGSNYLYDANGNLIQDNSYRYAYDEENRLTQIQRESDSAMVGQYVYDALGRRITRITDPAGPASTNYYYYDDVKLMEERDATGAATTTYTYGNYVDEVLTLDRSGQTYYYHPNAQWTPHALTDSTGTTVERYSYDAYGQVIVLDGSYNPVAPNAWGTPHSALTNRFLYTGRELDEEAGLYFYRARYFDAIKGRFLQRDPLDYRMGMDLYEYVKDNAANNVDPTGMKVIWTPYVSFNYDNKKWRSVNPIKPVGRAQRRLMWNCDNQGNVVNFIDTDESSKLAGVKREFFNPGWIFKAVYREPTSGPTTGSGSVDADCNGKKGKLVDIWFGVDEAAVALSIQAGATVSGVGVGVGAAFPEPSDGLQYHRIYKICCCCDGKATKTIVQPHDKWIERKSPDSAFSQRAVDDSFPGCIDSKVAVQPPKDWKEALQRAMTAGITSVDND